MKSVRLEECKVGRVLDWKIAIYEECKIGKVQDWKSARLEECKIGRLSKFVILCFQAEEDLKFSDFFSPILLLTLLTCLVSDVTLF